jgi:hypothetical protein
MKAEEGERGQGDEAKEKKEGGARGCGRELGEGLAESEGKGGGEQRGAAEAERLDARGTRPEAFFPTPQALLASGFGFVRGFGSGDTR